MLVKWAPGWHVSLFRRTTKTHQILQWPQPKGTCAMIKSLWRQNDAVASFWRHNDVIIASCNMEHGKRFTVGHRRRVTAVTRLPRWRRRKTPLQVRPFSTMLQDMDRCDFLHANSYWIGLTCYTIMFGHYASEWSDGALAFSDGRRVTWSKEADDREYEGGWHNSDSIFASCCWEVMLTAVLWTMQNSGSSNGPPTVEGWVVHLSSLFFILIPLSFRNILCKT